MARIQALTMSAIARSALPAEALLGAYVGRGAYTDCYAIEMGRPVGFDEFVAAFYTTPVFKLERWLISRTLGIHASDTDANALAGASTTTFSAWHVEAREPNQLLVAAGRTRSWFMAVPEAAGARTRLFFGSAVVPRARGGFGWKFRALLGFHKLYSRVLLWSAARRLANPALGSEAGAA